MGSTFQVSPVNCRAALEPSQAPATSDQAAGWLSWPG